MILPTDDFSLSGDELEFLTSQLSPTDRCFEFGTGVSTHVLAYSCRSVVSVEHSPVFAARACLALLSRSSVLFVPPDLPIVEGKEDGDAASFRSYIAAYTGESISVVLIDGRARVACARRVAETAPFGPHPGMKVFLHDADRPEYGEIWAPETGYFREVSRVGRLMLMEPNLNRVIPASSESLGLEVVTP